jgi:hypothetical protein
VNRSDWMIWFRESRRPAVDEQDEHHHRVVRGEVALSLTVVPPLGSFAWIVSAQCAAARPAGDHLRPGTLVIRHGRELRGEARGDGVKRSRRSQRQRHDDVPDQRVDGHRDVVQRERLMAPAIRVRRDEGRARPRRPDPRR